MQLEQVLRDFFASDLCKSTLGTPKLFVTRDQLDLAFPFVEERVGNTTERSASKQDKRPPLFKKGEPGQITNAIDKLITQELKKATNSEGELIRSDMVPESIFFFSTINLVKLDLSTQEMVVVTAFALFWFEWRLKSLDHDLYGSCNARLHSCRQSLESYLKDIRT